MFIVFGPSVRSVLYGHLSKHGSPQLLLRLFMFNGPFGRQVPFKNVQSTSKAINCYHNYKTTEHHNFQSPSIPSISNILKETALVPEKNPLPSTQQRQAALSSASTLYAFSCSTLNYFHMSRRSTRSKNRLTPTFSVIGHQHQPSPLAASHLPSLPCCFDTRFVYFPGDLIHLPTRFNCQCVPREKEIQNNSLAHYGNHQS